MVYNSLNLFNQVKSMVILSICVLLALTLFSVSYYIYRTAFYSPRNSHPTPDVEMRGSQYQAVRDHIHRIAHVMEKYPYESITIQSHDGLNLHGRYYHLKDGAPVEILCHGYRSHPYRDCSGGHALSRKLGYNALVIDQRAHGESEGVTISFGINERLDCQRWARYAADRFGPDVPLILSGLSMGAATVLMVSELELPESVCAIIADSPYSTPRAILEKVCADRRYPLFFCRPLITLSAQLFGRFDINACTAKDAVRHANVPILLIHGEDDRLVPWTMSRDIARYCASPVTVAIFPDAGHGLCYVTDPRKYEKAVVSFLSTVPDLRGTIDERFFRETMDFPI